MSEKIKPDDISFDSLMNRINEGLVKIPDFQRDFVWNRTQIINLLDSIYHHYPIGSFLFWITNEKLNVQRDIGNIKLPEPHEGATVNYVLDGQQRITSLFASLNDAEIKIRENGKTRKKKVQIFFDLDNKEFILNPGESEEETIGKIRGWWPLPGGNRAYGKTLLEILDAIKDNNFNEKNLADWIIKNYDTVKSRKTTSGYIDVVRKTGFVKIEGGLFKLTELGMKATETRDDDLIIRTLINNVDFFDSILEILSKHENSTMDEVCEYLEELKGLGWKSDAQVRWRLFWLLSLKQIDYIDGKYNLTENGKKLLDSLSLTDSPEKEDDVRYISVKKIVGISNLMEMLPKIKSESRKRAFDEVVTALNSYKFSVIYVKDQPLDIVCNIFERINNSGTILNVVDLMAAKTWSENFNLKSLLDKFKKELREYNYETIPDITILQCVSSHISQLCNRKAILSLTREQFEENWEKSLESIKKSIDFLTKKLNVCNSKIIPFAALIVPLSYFYYLNNLKDEDEKQSQEIMKWFWRASVSNRFDSGVEGKIAEDLKKIEKIKEGEEVEFEYPFLINKERIKNQNYSMRNAFCKTILCVFADKKPLGWKNNMEVNLNNSFSKYNSKEFHHIFPRSYLKKIDSELNNFVDSVANIAFIPSGLNKEFSDLAPSKYIEKLKNNSLGKTVKTHLIEDIEKSGLLEDDFEKFLEYRAEMILNRINILTGEFGSIEKGMLENEGEEIDLFEKQIRKIIGFRLQKSSINYWDEKIPEEMKKSTDDRIRQWLSKHPGTSMEEIKPLDFCFIMDYFKIIKSNWDLFEPMFKSRTELEKHFLNINDFRNAIKHPGRKVDLATKKLAEASLIWFDQVFKE